MTFNEKIAENNRLAEDNVRLTEELETHRAASLRVDGLERENKRLVAELKQALQQVQDVEKAVGGKEPRTTLMPSLSEPPSTALRSEGDGSGDTPNKTYEHWVRKYNKLYQNHADMSTAREQLEKLLGAKKEEMRKYQEYFDHLEKKVKKRNMKIEEQEEELRILRAQIQTADGGHEEEEGTYDANIGFAPSSTKEQDEGIPKGFTATRNASPLGIDGRNPAFAKGLLEAFQPFSHFKAPQGGFQDEHSDLIKTSTSGSSPAKESTNALGALNQERYGRVKLLDLPTLLTVRDDDTNERVVETEFEALEPHPTSPADGAAHSTSSEKPGAVEIKEELPTETPLSPDTPVIISSRSVRKSKGRNEAALPNDTPRVKIETISSSPIGFTAVISLDESIDLDDIGDKQVTPRKGRPFLQQSHRTGSSLAKMAQNERQSQDYSHSDRLNDSGQVSQATPTHHTGVSRTSSALQLRSANKQILPRTSAERPPKRRRIISDKAVADLIEDGQLIQSVEKSSHKRNTPTPEQARLLGDLLAKASPPKQLLRSPARLASHQSKPCQSGGRASAVSSRAYKFSRDAAPDTATFHPTLSKGYLRSKGSADSSRPVSRESVLKSVESSRPLSKGSTRSSVEPKIPPFRGTFRDSAYASRPTSRDSPEGQPGSSKPLKALPQTPAERSTPTPRYSNFEDSLRPSCKGSNGQHDSFKPAPKRAHLRSREETGTASTTRKQPLRTRPLGELKLQDFKVNPAYNQGYSYAFNAVVRNQEERRCLQGCTKPECCGGKFRALAEATRNPDQPLTLSQEEADEKTLEEFLGGNSYKLRNMTKDERYETLIQARAREMSNKYGKHRHAYERRTSPPGYWRSDFPTTQEEIQDRAKALQMERYQITQRHEAAMRPGGAYIFRDE